MRLIQQAKAARAPRIRLANRCFPSSPRVLLQTEHYSTLLSSRSHDNNRVRYGRIVFRQEIDRRESYSASSSPTSFTASDLSLQEFHQISDDTLHQLTDLLEKLVESDNPKVSGWDIDYSSGVMNFSIGEHGTYVLNKQPPNKQIWLSSPFSGPKRFDYDKNGQCWFYSRDGSQLIQLMRDEINTVLGDDTFSKLLSSS